ncbi:heterokaryon incompatibility protein-domain-containing protein, partial [Immersiella caudata]
MRLLHTQSYEISPFFGYVPPYAILSHRWLEEERRKGWPKIENCCKVAATDGWEYIWIDTCSINKSDSSELSEAINSMLRWYEEAQVCYAFLDDVPKQC